MLKTVKDMNLKGKNVFLRVDFNVPMEDGVVKDDTRIREALKTINYIVEQGGKLALGTHLGRPKGEKNLKYSLKPVVDYINSKGYFKAVFVEDCIGEAVEKAVNSQSEGTVLVLENLRFYNGEEKNDPEFVTALAKPFNAYVNDAFGTCHRKHASVYGIPSVMDEKGAGLLIEKEATYFDKLVKSPEHPFAAILGGSKVSDKIGVIKSLLDKADIILIGGAMAYTFLKYNGLKIGISRVEDDQMDTVKLIYEKASQRGVKILLPVDHTISATFGGAPVYCETADIADGMMGLDIGAKSIENYKNALSTCKTVLWNGPMGVFEQDDYAIGTYALANHLASLGITVVVGGGDSVAAANKAGVADKMSHISTGGGASLEYIEFGSLPGIDILR
ncbi:MAG: phosphoglycerate kinase [Deferribacteraceae bacterium]|jgi:phosphoglycerate kinase|nr:phosphoglycerate kinase [Deferribacteraceae bacterium]